MINWNCFPTALTGALQRISSTDFSEDGSRFNAHWKNKEFYSQDALGSTMLLTDAQGEQEEHYAYDAFGNVYEGSLNRGNGYGYTGKPYNPAARSYNYGFRDYRPDLGRFTAPDPIRDGNNWYAYCGNDPVNYVDLLGLLSDNAIPDSVTTRLEKDAKLQWLFDDHKISELPANVQDKFVNLYYASTTITEKQACNVFYENQLKAAGYGTVLKEINRTEGKSVIEKIDNYITEKEISDYYSAAIKNKIAAIPVSYLTRDEEQKSRELLHAYCIKPEKENLDSIRLFTRQTADKSLKKALGIMLLVKELSEDMFNQIYE